MPFYDFKCKSCEETTEVFCSMKEKDEKVKSLICKCGQPLSDDSELFGQPGHMFTNPEGTDKWLSEATGHDYRFKFNLPNVIKERERAERTSHMGKTPYGCVDVPIVPDKM